MIFKGKGELDTIMRRMPPPEMIEEQVRQYGNAFWLWNRCGEILD